ncbi:MAG: hypothetical protein ACYSU0_10220 [Planctomycetota bacterium]
MRTAGWSKALVPAVPAALAAGCEDELAPGFAGPDGAGAGITGPGAGLALGAEGELEADFEGSGSGLGVLDTVARSDHLHDADYVLKTGDTMTGDLTVAAGITATGNVTAAAFVGDGSALWGVDAELLDGLDSTAFMQATADSWVDIAGDTMTGQLVLPGDGLAVGTDQLVVSGGRVGVLTAAPATELEVNGTVTATAFVGDGSGLSVPGSAISSFPEHLATSYFWYVQSVPFSVEGVGYGGNVVDGTTGNVVLAATGFVYLRFTTDATTGSATGWRSGQVVARFQRPIFTMNVWPFDNTNVRIWCGLSFSNPTASDTPPANTMAFRYSSSADGTTWRAVTEDGTADGGTVTDTGVTAAGQTALQIDARTSGQVSFLINGTQAAVHTTNLPGAVGLRYFLQTVTTENVAKELRISKIFMHH